MAPQKEANGPSTMDLSVLEQGMRVQAQLQDVWYAAEIVEVSTSKKRAKAPVKVHYAGYTDGEDEWIGLGRLRSKALKGANVVKKEGAKAEKASSTKADAPDLSKLEKGTRVQACSGETWYSAEIIEVSTASRRAKAPVKVHYVGHDVTEDEWIALDCLRSKALKDAKVAAKSKHATPLAKAPSAGAPDLSGLEPGMRVQAMFADVWYAANIVQVSKAKNKAKTPVKVHFAGHDAAEDEWIGVDRLRSKALQGTAAKDKEASSTAKAAKADAGSPDLSKLEPGTRVQALFGETYYSAEVVQVSTAKSKAKTPIKVHYLGHEATEDEWVSVDRVRSKRIDGTAAKAKEAAPAAKAPAAKAAIADAEGPDLWKLATGMRVQALFGEVYYAAEVVEVSTAKRRSKAPVKVHYVGHDATEDQWVGVDRIQSKALKGTTKKTKESSPPVKVAAAGAVDLSRLEKGMGVQASFADVWYAAEIVQVSTAKSKAPIKVHFNGRDAAEDEWVSVDRVRSKVLKVIEAKVKEGPAPTKVAKTGSDGPDLTKLEKGMRVQAMFGEVYYAAEVVEVSTAKRRQKAPVKVHYAGHDATEDEWVGLDRLRSKALKGGDEKKAAHANATKGESTTGRTWAPRSGETRAAAGQEAGAPDPSKLEKGMRVQAMFGETWYAAEVVEVSTASRRAKAPIKVHYQGHDVTEDAWVSVERVRSKALTGAKKKGTKGEAAR